MGDYTAHNSNTNNSNGSIRESMGSTIMHANSTLVGKPFADESRFRDRLKLKIENINKHWMYNWVLAFQDFESWYNQKQTKSAGTGRGLSSIFAFEGGKSHTLKKVREKAQELQTKMVAFR
jgi:hypothetical protein